MEISELWRRRLIETLLLDRPLVMAAVVAVVEGALLFVGGFHLGFASVACVAFALFYISRMLIAKYRFLEDKAFPKIEGSVTAEVAEKLEEDALALWTFAMNTRYLGLGVGVVLALVGVFPVVAIAVNALLFGPLALVRANQVGAISKLLSTK